MALTLNANATDTILHVSSISDPAAEEKENTQTIKTNEVLLVPTVNAQVVPVNEDDLRPEDSIVLKLEAQDEALLKDMIANAGFNKLITSSCKEKKRKRQLHNLFLLFLCFVFYGVGFFLISFAARLNVNYKPGFHTIIGFALSRSLGLLVLIKTSSLNIAEVIQGHPLELTPVLVISVLAPFVVSWGYYTYDLLARENIDISVLSAITSIHIALPILYGLVILKEVVTSRKVFGFLLAFLAVVMLSLKDPASYTGNSFDADAILLMIGVITGWGGFLTISSITGKHFGWAKALSIFLSGNILLLILATVLAAANGHLQYMRYQEFWIYVAGHIVSTGGFGCYVKLTSDNEQSTYTALTSLWIIVPIVLGIVLLNEHPSSYAIAGFILTLCAIMVLLEE